MAAAVLATGCLGTTVHAASFDCKKGHSANEKMICSDPALSAADDDLGAIYKRAKRVAPNARAFREQNESEWEWRENNCHDKTCLVTWYQMRTRQLEQVVADANRPDTPARPSTPGTVATQSTATIQSTATTPSTAASPKTASTTSTAANPSTASAPSRVPAVAQKTAATQPDTPAAVPLQAPQSGPASVPQADSDALPIMVFRNAQNPDVTAKQLYQDYKRNAAAADVMYKGKSIRFTGTILRVKQDPYRPLTVEFATGDVFDTVDAHWTVDNAPAPASLHPGSTVTLNCRGDGIAMGSPSLRCE